MDSDSQIQMPPKFVKCPTCMGPSVYAPQNPFRPFCCERCKHIDFGAWSSEHFRVPTEAPNDEESFGDPKLQ